MTKRANDDDDGEEGSFNQESANQESASPDEASPPPPKKPRKATAKKPEKKEAKPKASKKASSPSGSAGKGNVAKNVFTNAEGDKFVDLGKKKRVTVRSFKGAVLVDIREFYGQGDDLLPGKKGISLSPEQWAELKANADSIDGLIKKLQT